MEERSGRKETDKDQRTSGTARLTAHAAEGGMKALRRATTNEVMGESHLNMKREEPKERES